jgi:hypothetical protein
MPYQRVPAREEGDDDRDPYQDGRQNNQSHRGNEPFHSVKELAGANAVCIRTRSFRILFPFNAAWGHEAATS